MKYSYYLIIVLRILVAPLILIWPLQSIILSFFLDLIDGDLAPYAVTKINYQKIDKLLDFWVYIFELIFAWSAFPDYRILLLSLILWKLAGLIIFFLSGQRWIFIIFGNYFEAVFFVLFFKIVFINIPVTFLIAILIKVFIEWFIHVANLSVREDILKSKRKWRIY